MAGTSLQLCYKPFGLLRLENALHRVTFVHPYSTFGSLTFRVSDVKLASVSLPLWLVRLQRGCRMKLIHLCYAAVGFAVARWLFKREPLPVDPVAQFRTSGLL